MANLAPDLMTLKELRVVGSASVYRYKGKVYADRYLELPFDNRTILELIWDLHSRGLVSKTTGRNPAWLNKTFTIYQASPQGLEFLKELGL